jgi:hypothetical protein
MGEEVVTGSDFSTKDGNRFTEATMAMQSGHRHFGQSMRWRPDSGSVAF